MTWKALFIGAIIVIITAYLCPLVEAYHFEIDFTAIPPSIATMFFFFVVVMLNLLLVRFAARFRLSKNELMLIYAMTMVGAPLCSLGLVQFLIPNMLAPFHFATPENMWKEDFLRYIPEWFGPRDAGVMRDFYKGTSQGVPWDAWIFPLLIWCSFALVLYFVLLCICAILRKQWVERERLTFGLLQAPVKLVEEPQEGNLLNSLLSNKIMWLGFFLPILVQITVGLHHHFPAFPSFKLMRIRFDPYLTTKPFSAIKPIWISVMYSIVGIAYLAPADVSFSCWFFYFFTKAEDVLAVTMGWRGTSTSTSFARFPDINNQGVGAFFALCVVGLWTMRRHLWRILKTAFSSQKESDDSNEPMSYRTAVLGFILGIAFLLFWLWMLGLSPFWGAALLGIFFVYQIALSRIRAETGIGFIWNPKAINDVLVAPFGTARLGTRSLTAMASVEVLHSHNYLLMPSFLEGYKISDVSKVRGRHLTAVILIGIFLYIAVSSVSVLEMYYKYGADECGTYRIHRGRYAFTRLESWISNPKPPDYTGLGFMAGGAAFYIFLAFMRLKFLWWKFHPIGYALANEPVTMPYMWFSFFIGWSVKVTAMKYGGAKAYRKVVPFFLGLIIGETVGNGFWVVILGEIFGVHGFAYFLS